MAQADPVGSPHPEKPLHIAVARYTGDIHNIVANTLNLYEGDWPQPIVMETIHGQEGVTALDEGRAELATVPILTYIKTALQQQRDAVPEDEQMVVVARLSYVAGLNIIVADREQGIETHADIVSRPVGTPPGTVTELLLSLILQGRNLDDSDLSFVPVEPAEMEAALRDGRIATALVWTPFLDQIVASDPERFHILPSGDTFTGAMLLVSQNRYLKQHRAQIRAYLAGLLAAEDLYFARPEDVIALVASNQGVSEAAVRRTFLHSSYALQVETFPPYLYQPIARWWCDKNGLSDCVIRPGTFRASYILREVERDGQYFSP
ncbi:ABC transporter substrate-binding protein [Rhodovulum adriaticum]|nr:ABC transporter substrate-binding protein [Rhodovulum adriaticum]